MLSTQRIILFFKKLKANHIAQLFSLILALFSAPLASDASIWAALVILVTLDVVTRLIANYKNEVKFSFKEFITGLAIKVFGFGVLAALAIVSTVFAVGAVGEYIRNVIYFFLPLTEATSIVKNLVDCGLTQFTILLQQFQYKIDTANPDDINESTTEKVGTYDVSNNR